GRGAHARRRPQGGLALGGASGARRVLQRGLGAVLRPLPAEEVLARSDPLLRLAGVPPDPLRDRRVPRAHLGQPAPGPRRSSAATLGASAAFLVGRYLARAAVERRIAANPRFAAIDRAVGAEGRKIVFLLRLSPVFPFNLLNYALGLTRVRFADFFLASVGMLPGTVLYVYSGKLIGDVTGLAEDHLRI